jgi:hypothetical protein
MKKAAVVIGSTLVIGIVFGYVWGRSQTPITQIVSGDTAPTAATSTAMQTPQVISVQPRTISLMVDYGDGMVRVYPDIVVGASETMLQMLEKQAQTGRLTFKTKEFAGLGTMIEAIGTKTNGQDNKYWQYWVNNVSITYAASNYLLKPGDVIEWKFLHYK